MDTEIVLSPGHKASKTGLPAESIDFITNPPDQKYYPTVDSPDLSPQLGASSIPILRSDSGGIPPLYLNDVSTKHVDLEATEGFPSPINGAHLASKSQSAHDQGNLSDSSSISAPPRTPPVELEDLGILVQTTHSPLSSPGSRPSTTEVSAPSSSPTLDASLLQVPTLHSTRASTPNAAPNSPTPSSSLRPLVPSVAILSPSHHTVSPIKTVGRESLTQSAKRHVGVSTVETDVSPGAPPSPIPFRINEPPRPPYTPPPVDRSPAKSATLPSPPTQPPPRTPPLPPAPTTVLAVPPMIREPLEPSPKNGAPPNLLKMESMPQPPSLSTSAITIPPPPSPPPATLSSQPVSTVLSPLPRREAPIPGPRVSPIASSADPAASMASTPRSGRQGNIGTTEQLDLYTSIRHTLRQQRMPPGPRSRTPSPESSSAKPNASTPLSPEELAAARAYQMQLASKLSEPRHRASSDTRSASVTAAPSSSVPPVLSPRLLQPTASSRAKSTAAPGTVPHADSTKGNASTGPSPVMRATSTPADNKKMALPRTLTTPPLRSSSSVTSKPRQPLHLPKQPYVPPEPEQLTSAVDASTNGETRAKSPVFTGQFRNDTASSRRKRRSFSQGPTSGSQSPTDASVQGPPPSLSSRQRIDSPVPMRYPTGLSHPLPPLRTQSSRLTGGYLNPTHSSSAKESTVNTNDQVPLQVELLQLEQNFRSPSRLPQPKGSPTSKSTFPPLSRSQSLRTPTTRSRKHSNADVSTAVPSSRASSVAPPGPTFSVSEKTIPGGKKYREFPFSPESTVLESTFTTNMRELAMIRTESPSPFPDTLRNHSNVPHHSHSSPAIYRARPSTGPDATMVAPNPMYSDVSNDPLASRAEGPLDASSCSTSPNKPGSQISGRRSPARTRRHSLSTSFVQSTVAVEDILAIPRPTHPLPSSGNFEAASSAEDGGIYAAMDMDIGPSVSGSSSASVAGLSRSVSASSKDSQPTYVLTSRSVYTKGAMLTVVEPLPGGGHSEAKHCFICYQRQARAKFKEGKVEKVAKDPKEVRQRSSATHPAERSSEQSASSIETDDYAIAHQLLDPETREALDGVDTPLPKCDHSELEQQKYIHTLYGANMAAHEQSLAQLNAAMVDKDNMDLNSLSIHQDVHGMDARGVNEDIYASPASSEFTSRTMDSEAKTTSPFPIAHSESTQPSPAELSFLENSPPLNSVDVGIRHHHPSELTNATTETVKRSLSTGMLNLALPLQPPHSFPSPLSVGHTHRITSNRPFGFVSEEPLDGSAQEPPALANPSAFEANLSPHHQSPTPSPRMDPPTQQARPHTAASTQYSPAQTYSPASLDSPLQGGTSNTPRRSRREQHAFPMQSPIPPRNYSPIPSREQAKEEILVLPSSPIAPSALNAAPQVATHTHTAPARQYPVAQEDLSLSSTLSGAIPATFHAEHQSLFATAEKTTSHFASTLINLNFAPSVTSTPTKVLMPVMVTVQEKEQPNYSFASSLDCSFNNSLNFTNLGNLTWHPSYLPASLTGSQTQATEATQSASINDANVLPPLPPPQEITSDSSAPTVDSVTTLYGDLNASGNMYTPSRSASARQAGSTPSSSTQLVWKEGYTSDGAYKPPAMSANPKLLPFDFNKRPDVPAVSNTEKSIRPVQTSDFERDDMSGDKERQQVAMKVWSSNETGGVRVVESVQSVGSATSTRNTELSPHAYPELPTSSSTSIAIDSPQPAPQLAAPTNPDLGAIQHMKKASQWMPPPPIAASQRPISAGTSTPSAPPAVLASPMKKPSLSALLSVQSNDSSGPTSQSQRISESSEPSDPGSSETVAVAASAVHSEIRQQSRPVDLDQPQAQQQQQHFGTRSHSSLSFNRAPTLPVMTTPTDLPPVSTTTTTDTSNVSVPSISIAPSVSSTASSIATTVSLPSTFGSVPSPVPSASLSALPAESYNATSNSKFRLKPRSLPEKPSPMPTLVNTNSRPVQPTMGARSSPVQPVAPSFSYTIQPAPSAEPMPTMSTPHAVPIMVPTPTTAHVPASISVPAPLPVLSSTPVRIVPRSASNNTASNIAYRSSSRGAHDIPAPFGTPSTIQPSTPLLLSTRTGLHMGGTPNVGTSLGRPVDPVSQTPDGANDSNLVEEAMTVDLMHIRSKVALLKKGIESKRKEKEEEAKRMLELRLAEERKMQRQMELHRQIQTELEDLYHMQNTLDHLNSSTVDFGSDVPHVMIPALPSIPASPSHPLGATAHSFQHTAASYAASQPAPVLRSPTSQRTIASLHLSASRPTNPTFVPPSHTHAPMRANTSYAYENTEPLPQPMLSSSMPRRLSGKRIRRPEPESTAVFSVSGTPVSNVSPRDSDLPLKGEPVDGEDPGMRSPTFENTSKSVDTDADIETLRKQVKREREEILAKERTMFRTEVEKALEDTRRRLEEFEVQTGMEVEEFKQKELQKRFELEQQHYETEQRRRELEEARRKQEESLQKEKEEEARRIAEALELEKRNKEHLQQQMTMMRSELRLLKKKSAEETTKREVAEQVLRAEQERIMSLSQRLDERRFIAEVAIMEAEVERQASTHYYSNTGDSLVNLIKQCPSLLPILYPLSKLPNNRSSLQNTYPPSSAYLVSNPIVPTLPATRTPSSVQYTPAILATSRYGATSAVPLALTNTPYQTPHRLTYAHSYTPEHGSMNHVPPTSYNADSAHANRYQ